MTSLRRALVGLGIAGFFAGLAALLLALGSDHLEDKELVVVLGPLIGWSFIGTGLFAWWRQPENRFGALMTAVGFGWCLSGLTVANPAEIFVIGVLFGPLPYALLVHMLLAFPHGQLRSRFERWLVAGGYFITTVVQWVAVPFFDTTDEDQCGCPANPLQLMDSEATAEAILSVQSLYGSIAIAILVVLLIRRWRGSAGLQRRAYTPVAIAGGVVAALLLVSLVADLSGGWDSIEQVVDYGSLIVLATVPFAFLVGLLRSHVERSHGIRRLVTGLGAAGGERVELREALADALGDPSLQLAYWVPERGGYVDADGRAVELPSGDRRRTCTVVEGEEGPVAAIIHDGSLAQDREIVRAAGAAAALALENERLDAELRAKVEELRESRARIVESGDAERRRLERDLHDGAQQRLVSLALNLRLARAKLRVDPAAADALLESSGAELDLALGELRELARGIHPAVLSDRGLPAALETLANRAPMPVELEEWDTGRLSEPVEAAAYFVVAEALTNVAKYAEATRAHVQLRRDNGALVVEVADDGVGGADAGRGSGLRGLADRVAALDGKLEVDSPAGAGTTVRARIPCA